MKKFGLIGYPLSHSFSQKYFSEKFKKEGILDCVACGVTIAEHAAGKASQNRLVSPRDLPEGLRVASCHPPH